MFRKLLPFLGGGLGLAIILSVVVLKPVLADVSTNMVPAGISQMGFGNSQVDEYLAKALNISVEQLQTAYQKAETAMLDQAVKDGDITQKLEDEIKADGFRMPFMRGSGSMGSNKTSFDQYLADALGITIKELQAAQQAAYNARIDQAVADGALSKDRADLIKGQRALFSSQSFRDAMQSAFSDAVKKAVTDGVITQTQADQILKSYSNPGFMFPGMGRQGGWKGLPRMMGPNDDQDNNSASPTPYPAPTESSSTPPSF